MFAQQKNEAMTIEEIAEQRVRDALEGFKDRFAEVVSTKKARSDSSVGSIDMEVEEDWDDWSNDFTFSKVGTEATKAFFTGKEFGEYVKKLREEVDETKSCILALVEKNLWEAVRILPEGFKGEGLSRLRGVDGDLLSDELKTEVKNFLETSKGELPYATDVASHDSVLNNAGLSEIFKKHNIEKVEDKVYLINLSKPEIYLGVDDGTFRRKLLNYCEALQTIVGNEKFS
ncbi:hypothetical protein TrLO_g2569 [Triparma laevis f. longispina]|uniref:Uncharacterized protein n=1 Tax=Triparma laevis f. longispina TaxID=1714387 RepID=A0A9W7AZ94_9STRA|nr:hypothetical protein TrLO_g2569 [Triparma laevis f. longispina]